MWVWLDVGLGLGMGGCGSVWVCVHICQCVRRRALAQVAYVRFLLVTYFVHDIPRVFLGLVATMPNSGSDRVFPDIVRVFPGIYRL